MINFVYFDVGGVVVSDLSYNNGWVKMKKDLGVTTDIDKEFDDFYDNYEHQICLGLETDKLIPEISEKFGLSFPAGYSLLTDFISRFKANRSLWPVIRKIKKKAGVGLLTNMYPRMLSKMTRNNLMPDLVWDTVVDSSVEHVSKPSPEIYTLAEKKSGVSGSNILFVDNNPKNTTAAKRFGWQTFLYNPTTPASSSRQLSKIIDDILKL